MASAKFVPKAEGEIGGPCKILIEHPNLSETSQFCSQTLKEAFCASLDDTHGYCARGFKQGTAQTCADVSEAGAQKPVLPGYWSLEGRKIKYTPCPEKKYVSGLLLQSG